jgi:hypothetical protein
MNFRITNEHFSIRRTNFIRSTLSNSKNQPLSKTIFDIAIAVDGFMTGGNRSPQNPIGDGGLTLTFHMRAM